MSEGRPLSARDRIARLRATFVGQLPQRIEQIRALYERLMADPGDHATVVELHRLMHSLKGTGRSFGFNDLGATAGHSESLMAELLEMPTRPAPSNWQSRLGQFIDYIEMTASVLGSPPAGEANEVRSDAPLLALPELASQTAFGGSERLLYLCDDETLPLEQMSAQLACFGYTTRTFTDLRSFHDAVIERWPDAVVMDVRFPGNANSGIEMLASLREETGKTVPAIIVSARDDFAARLAAVQAGGEAYFHKPANVMDMLAVLDELTRQQPPEPFRILVIDDEPEIASYHCIILQEAGMTTAQLNDPENLLPTLREFRPDMVLMDVYLPKCNGRELASVIRQLPDFVGLPIVYLSSETDRQKQFSAMRVGAEGFLTKPVIPEDLVSAVAIRAERMRTLRSLMARDSLTGLFNHTTTTQLLDAALATARRAGSSLSFVMIDLDLFKSINDSHGHPVGDQVILVLSRILRQRLRNSDIVGRYGGEEFAVVLPNVTLERAGELIDELRRDFGRVVFHAADVGFRSSFSAGIAAYPRHQHLESLRQAADRALYAAKHAGRNRVVLDQDAA